MIKIQKKSLLSILFFLLLLPFVQAQFPTDMSYQSIQTPGMVAMPNLGESVVDQSVLDPIEITRITEPYNYVDGDGNPQVWYPTHEYAKTQVWNADESLFKIRTWKIIDATSYQEVQSLSGDIYPSYWSNTDPDLIWSFKENGDVKKHTVSNNMTQTVANIPGYEFVQLGPGEGNIDKNDHYVALVGKKANGDLDVIIFDLQILQVIHTETFAGAWANGGLGFPEYIDWVSVSQSGNYVVIMWNHNTTSENNPFNGHYGVEVYNTINMQFQNRIISYGNHGDLGYAIDGEEVLVQFYGLYGNGTIYMHKLNGTGSTVLNTDTDFGVAGHISCRNLNRPGWAYVTHSLPAQSGQLVAVKLDNSGLVEHFGHHFSSATSYEQAAMGVSSPNGDKICFKSDFGTGPNTNPSVAYIFISKLAAPLPVSLINFEAMPVNNNSVEISWSTSSEIDHWYFDVERSEDGEKFNKIETILGNEHSFFTKTYKIIDEAPVKGVSYYRLKLVDLDGGVEYSKVEMIDIQNTTFFPTVFPNPARDMVNVEHEVPIHKVFIYNGVGQLIESLDGAGTRRMRIDVNNFESGIYFLGILTEGGYGEVMIKKVIIN